jgi:Co/Zn/Cd efflux system component
MTIEGVLSYREPHFWWLVSGELVGTLHVQIAEVITSYMLCHAPSQSLPDLIMCVQSHE